MELYKSLHDRLENQHFAIAQIIKNISPERMLVRPAESKWNIHDNIAHLAKYQITFIERLQFILKNPNSQIERYVADEDAEFEIFKKMNDNDLIKSINDQRLILSSLIFGLQKDDLEKIGIHKKFGPLNIIQWAEFFVLHESHHLFTIFKLVHDADI